MRKLYFFWKTAFLTNLFFPYVTVTLYISVCSFRGWKTPVLLHPTFCFVRNFQLCFARVRFVWDCFADFVSSKEVTKRTVNKTIEVVYESLLKTTVVCGNQTARLGCNSFTSGRYYVHTAFVNNIYVHTRSHTSALPTKHFLIQFSMRDVYKKITQMFSIV